MVDSIGGRKLVMALLLLLVGLGATYLKGDIPANLLTLIQTLFGAFVVGNAIEHATTGKKSKKQDSEVMAKLAQIHLDLANTMPLEAPQQPVDIGPVQNQIDALSKRLAVNADALSGVQQGVQFIVDYIRKTG